VLEQFKCFILRQNKLTSLETCSTTKAGNQSVEMVRGEQKEDCSINHTHISKWYWWL